MNNSFLVCLIHGHGVDASIWEGIYADLVSACQVSTPDFSRLTSRTTIIVNAGYLSTIEQPEASMRDCVRF